MLPIQHGDFPPFFWWLAEGTGPLVQEDLEEPEGQEIRVPEAESRERGPGGRGSGDAKLRWWSQSPRIQKMCDFHELSKFDALSP